MTDRKLLELAAKAAGMWKADFSLNDDDQPDFHEEKGFRLSWGRGWWNPLTDDGDALRLAVKLRLLVDPDGETRAVATATPKGRGSFIAHEKHREDPYAATRRVIVRAAAEIGKAMQ